MKLITLLISLFITQASIASITCRDFQNPEEYLILRSGNVLTRENWKTIDVVLTYDYQQCVDIFSQTLIKVRGEFFWVFKSTHDKCDGGNTYGSIYSYDLKTPMAHIYDGDIVCEEKWKPVHRSISHKCDLMAESLAQKKMKEFGLDFVNLGSSLQLRPPYPVSFIFVSGEVANRGGRKATVRVGTDIENCEFSTVSISNLKL